MTAGDVVAHSLLRAQVKVNIGARALSGVVGVSSTLGTTLVASHALARPISMRLLSYNGSADWLRPIVIKG